TLILGLILRTEAQIPNACLVSQTNRPPGSYLLTLPDVSNISVDFHPHFLPLLENSDISVVCGTQYMDLSIYLCPIYQALYNESLMVVNDEFNKPECFGAADWNVDPPILNFRFPINESSISSCENKLSWSTGQVGSGQFSDFSNVQYVNISGIVTSLDPSAGMITYRPQILYKFSCLYPMQYLLNNTELAVLAIRDNNGTFISTLSMELYKVSTCCSHQKLLVIPTTGLNLKTKIYVAVIATNLTDRFNVLLDRCYATTSPYPNLNTYYDLFVGCTRDEQTKVELNGVSQRAQFSFEAFRFVEQKNQTISTFYLHCVTRLCEVSSCSGLLPDCGSTQKRRKREAENVSSNTTVTSTAIIVKQSTGTPWGQIVTIKYIPTSYHNKISQSKNAQIISFTSKCANLDLLS
uniref:ZP domain-containing protein n=1 Tax=Mola mola TaxID=94237 RepID=A0A3Q3WTB7_MOLML